MKYRCTRDAADIVSFQDAVLKGLSDKGGLYFPMEIPVLEEDFFANIESYSDTEIARKVLAPYVEGSLTSEQLEWVVEETLSFKIPTVRVADDCYILEVFHGPTKAFKDVGARFLSRCLSQFEKKADQDTVVLVATSGDTGSAVAHGFYGVPNVQVKILFPKGKVSPYQEFQMTSLGGNIQAVEVNGTFDDCQAIVKACFDDESLRSKINLSSANSINMARLLPQMLYYFFMYRDIKAQLASKKIVVSVPSGNLGNITAGIIGKHMGLPIERFIAAHNENDTFPKYLQGEAYTPKPSVQTYANAMDVGAPSNYERLAHLYEGNLESMKKDIEGISYTDEQILTEIKATQQDHGYLLDPHAAIGKMALDELVSKDEVGVFVGTAHPQKFSEVIAKVIPDYSGPEVDLSTCEKISMDNSLAAFKKILLS